MRTLRHKLGELCEPAGAAAAWSGVLAKEWMDGQPFFLVRWPVDPGLIEVLRTAIVPRLIAEAPGQPSAAELAAEPLRHRFTIIHDRAGYSPDYFAEMKALRVAVITYHKFPGEDWPAGEFAPQTLTLVHGETVTLALAERGTRLSNGLWVREVREREDGGHQVSVIATDYRSALAAIAVRMFARWTKENFLKYMREHYAIDRLVEYGVEALPATTTLVNPVWRRLGRRGPRRAGAARARASAVRRVEPGARARARGSGKLAGAKSAAARRSHDVPGAPGRVEGRAQSHPASCGLGRTAGRRAVPAAARRE